MINPQQLQYLLAIDRFRHFGRAAESCRITQPSLSQQVQKIEEELGIVLFDRTRKPILTTPEGEVFLAQARIVLREHSKLLEISKDQGRHGVIEGKLRLGVLPTVAGDLIPLLLGAFTKTLPKVELELEELTTERILESLREDRIDAGVLATPIEDQDFHIHPLYYEPFLAYLSVTHPARKKEKLRAQDLAPEEMWILQEGHCFKDQALRWCQSPYRSKVSREARTQFRSGSLDTLRKLVQAYQGYTLLPALMVHQLPAHEQKKHVRHFESPEPTREISLIYRRDHWKLKMLRALEKMIPESVAGPLEQFTPQRKTVLPVENLTSQKQRVGSQI
jgi:LysR family hydrogen peroxide-inducible transcriptional activator